MSASNGLSIAHARRVREAEAQWLARCRWPLHPILGLLPLFEFGQS